MKRQEKNEIYSIRKFKVGVGSALIGLSILGTTGALSDVPVIGDVFGIESVKADSWSGGQIKVYYRTSEGTYVDESAHAYWENDSSSEGGYYITLYAPNGYRFSEGGDSMVYRTTNRTNVVNVTVVSEDVIR